MLGLFDAPSQNPYNQIEPSVVGCKAHQDLALEAARQSMVLLKNKDNFLTVESQEGKIHSRCRHQCGALRVRRLQRYARTSVTILTESAVCGRIRFQGRLCSLGFRQRRIFEPGDGKTYLPRGLESGILPEQ